MDEFAIRTARREDVTAIVAMLADDALGARREELREPLPAAYFEAFEAIQRDPNQNLVVAEIGGRVVGTLQLTLIASLSRRGSTRAVIEAVRVASDCRGAGLGRRLIQWAVQSAAASNCAMVQLTTDKTRGDAIRFYRSLGFEPSHEGMKLHIDPSDHCREEE